MAWEKANVISSKAVFCIHQNRMSEAHAVFDAAMSEGLTIVGSAAITAGLDNYAFLMQYNVPCGNGKQVG